MNQKGFAKVILVVIIAIVAIGVFLEYEHGNYIRYYIFHKGMPPGYCDPWPCNENMPTPTSNQTQTKTPASPTPPPEDETVNWKTTTNSSLGYSVKYPNGWKAETNNLSTTLTNLSNSEQVIMIELSSANANPNRLSINEWLRTQQWPDPKPISEQFKSIANVGGVSAAEQSLTGTVYFTKDTNVFVVNNGVSFTRKVVDEKLFLQILSTFKFTR